MTNTATVTKALRSAGYTVTTDMPHTLKVKKTRFKEETSVTVCWNIIGNWNSTTDWNAKYVEVCAKLVELGLAATFTPENGIEIAF
jgi:hypothetical protein